MIICGIDPGTAATGWGIIRKQDKQLTCLDYGVIATSAGTEQGERLKIINNELAKLLKKHQPDLMAVETVFFFKNLKTAMPVSEARGVILLAAAKKKIKMQQISPLQVKMTVCNYGRAEKKQVQRMVQKILNLKELPKPDDAADALAVAICSARSSK